MHAERAVIRPLSTTSTGGLGNPLLSLVEDLGALGLTALAFLVPFLALLLVVLLLALGRGLAGTEASSARAETLRVARRQTGVRRLPARDR